MISDFAGGLAQKLNASALMEQSALLACICSNDKPKVQEIINACGQGDIIAYHSDPSDEVPSYFVYRQGRTYGVVLSGSENVRNLLGVGISSEVGGRDKETEVVNAYAYRLSIDLLTTLKKIIPENRTLTKLKITGFSLGGMCAQIISHIYAKILMPSNVQCMTFGSPKVWSEGFSDMVAMPLINIGSFWDVVRFEPSYRSVFVVPRPGKFGISFPINGWRHRADNYEIIEDGSIVAREPTYYDSADRFLNPFRASWFTEHNIYKYLAKSEMLVFHVGRTAQDFVLTDIVEPLLTRTSADRSTENFNITDYITLADINAANAPGIFPGWINANNVNRNVTLDARINVDTSGLTRNIGETGEFMAVPSIWKISLIINNGQSGRMESHVLSGISDYATVKARALELAQYRASLLGSNIPSGPRTKNISTPFVEYVRISDPLNPKNAELVPLDVKSGNFCGYRSGTGKNSPADHFAVAVSARLKGAAASNTDVKSYANLSIIGQPDGCYDDGVYKGTTVTVTTGITFDTVLRTYIAYLVGNNYGFMGQKLSVTKKNWTQAVFGNDNTWTIKCVAHGYGTGDKVRVTASDVKDFNGLRTVEVVGVDTLRFTPGPSSIVPAATKGKIQLQQKANGERQLEFYKYESLGPISIRKKNPGRQFDPVSFKKRPRQS